MKQVSLAEEQCDVGEYISGDNNVCVQYEEDWEEQFFSNLLCLAHLNRSRTMRKSSLPHLQGLRDSRMQYPHSMMCVLFWIAMVAAMKLQRYPHL